MTANPILLQKKYTRVVTLFAERAGIELDSALSFFYGSELYPLLRDGVSDMHCRSDGYLADELMIEFSQKSAG